MRRDEFPELRQFFGFLYMDPNYKRDDDFRQLKPVADIQGTMIEHLSASRRPLFMDLVEPRKPSEVISIMKNAGKYGMLKHSIDHRIKLSPGPSEIRYSTEVSGDIPSKTGHRVYQYVSILKAFNEFTFQINCSDENWIKNERICGVWHPVILSEWGLPINRGKYQIQPVCAHARVLDRRVERERGSKPLGESFVDDIRPYALAYLNVLEKYPRIPDYLINFALTFFSPIYDDLKERVNVRRRRAGLRDLVIYDGEIYDGVSVKQYIAWRLNNALKSSKRLKGRPEGINDVIETLNFYPPIELEGPSYLRPEIDILDETVL